MDKRLLTRTFAVVLTSALVLTATAASGAAPIGPVYPLPGGPGAGHGGSTCLALTPPSPEAAMGKPGGQTWFYGGGTDPAQTGTGCPTDSDPGAHVTPFDTTRFERLFWGASSAPELALDGLVDNVGGTSETLAFDLPASDRAGGKLVWTGSTRMAWCVPASCSSFTTTQVPVRFVLTATSLAGAPVALLDPATVGADAAAGGLVEVTPALRNFKVNIVMEADNPSTAGETFEPAIAMYNSLNHPVGGDPQTRMGFGGGFRYVSRAPTGSIAHSTLVKDQAATFTATASDPDGTVVSYAWALGADGVFDDGTTPSVQGTFGVGTHTVRALVTDDDGTTTTLTDTFTIAEPVITGPPVTGPPVTGPPVTGPPVADTTAPIAAITVSGTKLSKILKRGLKATTTTNEAGTIALTVAIPTKIAKKLKLKNPLAKRTVVAAAAGAYPVTIKLSKKVVKKLKTLRKVKVTVTATVTDAAGNHATVSKSITAKK